MATPVAIIKKRGDKYHIVSHKGKTLGVHSTREGALKQEQAIEIAKHARQLVENVGSFLAATEHDERGRFTGPGGGYQEHASKAIQATEKAHTAINRGRSADHIHKLDQKAAALHQKAADSAAKSGNESARKYHQEFADHHSKMAQGHEANVKLREKHTRGENESHEDYLKRIGGKTK